MGIYNGIHTTDDDHYYYCPDRYCSCHGPSYYDDSSRNNYDSSRNNYDSRGNNYVERTGYYNFTDGGNLNVR